MPGSALLAGMVFALTASGQGAGSTSEPNPATSVIAPMQGALAPDLSLMNLRGDEVSPSDFRGRPVLINFWAAWCAPCRIEMPAVQDRFERHKDQGFVVLAVDFDKPASAVEAFRDELGLTFELLLDPGVEIQMLYRNSSYPTSFFVDANGVIRVHHIGAMAEEQLDENLAAIGLTPEPIS